MKISTTLFGFIWHFLKQYRGTLLVFLGVGIVWAADLSITPFMIKLIIDRVISQGDNIQSLLQLLLFPALVYVSMPFIMMLNFRIYDYTCMMLFPRLKVDVLSYMFSYVSNHSYAFFQEQFAGAISKKISDMGESLEPVIRIPNEVFIPRVFAVIVAALMLLFVKPIFSIIIITWSVLYVLMTYYLASGSEKHVRVFMESFSVYNGKIIDSLTNIITTKIFSNESAEKRKVNKALNNMAQKDQDMQRYMLKIHVFQGSSIIILALGMIGSLIYGRIQGWITVGDFAFVLNVSENISTAIYNIGLEMVRFTREVGKCKQALTVITPDHDTRDAKDALPLFVNHGKIEFVNVNFGYRGKNIALRDLSLTIPAGQKVGLVGFSGGGKSTFVSLILRLFDLNSGQIFIDGQDISKVTKDSLRKSIAMIPQSADLYHRTILDNIRAGRLEATEEEVIEASKKAYCHDFVVKLENGYHTMVGERGVKLSGGQRQRIAIARAILKQAPILIMDEATSALDSVTEKYIQKSLHELMEGKTTIVIAHRLSTLLEMNRILFFKDGQIVEDGSLRKLKAKKGLFAELWKMQGGGYLPDEDELE